MPIRFILQRVVFGDNSWRKLSGLEIPIAPRMTVIAGHNGIGKSSILGFIANASGCFARNLGGEKTYFRKEFISKFEEQFRLSDADISTNDNEKGYIVLEYKAGDIVVAKACNIGTTTLPSGELRYRVVPRTRGKSGEQLGVKPDGKIPMPTIFVSASRTWPIAESPKVELKNSSIDKEDADFIKSFHNQIIPGEVVDSDGCELDLGFSSSHVVRSQQPAYKYDATTISLGQGAISSIATAIVSFKRLKRKLGRKYVGGVLVIDEIEAGLHPRAQVQLAKILLREAKLLNLQVVVTTHSLVFIEQIYNVSKNKEAIDDIVYLMDTKKPCVRRLTLKEMQEEMLLSKTAFSRKRKEALMVYTEDSEALFFLRQIIKFGKIDEKVTGAIVRKAPLKIGCGQLIKLARNKTAAHFSKYSVCVLDGDQSNQDLEGLVNCIKLPTAAGLLRSPEQEVESFLVRAMGTTGGKEREALIKRNVSWDYMQKETSELSEKLRNVNKDEKRRNIYKKWFGKISAAKRSDIIAAWVEVHLEEVKGFADKYLKALSAAKKQLIRD